MKNHFLAEQEKAANFDFWFSFWLHVLETIGAVFILGIFAFGLIMADALFRGIF